ncbi:MAG: Na+/H+ antiporter NhaC family protein [Candidatus Latescibacterota bacterium]|nr:MAG: Na+/H+ antiporter NhaC family protein [Candidatus Latescibacterota bacterium]
MNSRMRPLSRPAILILINFLLVSPAYGANSRTTSSPLKIPKAIISGLPFDCEFVASTGEQTPFSVDISKGTRSFFSHSGTFPERVSDVILPESGRYRVVIRSGSQTWEQSVRVLPGLFTVLPPVLAILMALLFRQVVIALFAGVWLGAFFVNDFNVVRSFFYVVDHYVVDSLAGESGWDHVSIAIFTLLLGGMVGVFSSIGGTQGVVNEISKIATNPRRGQLATWMMGIAIFFDDYTNTLIVGNTMRPITDRLRISREKLSYIVDSTAAPVACIAVITSWIGFEISLIKDAYNALGIDRNPFTTFVASIQYSFYPIVTLLFGLLVAASTRDFGPMLKAERRARKTGQVLSQKAVPLSNIDTEIQFDAARSPRWFNAVIPVVVVVLGTFVGLVLTGRSALIESGVTGYSLMDTIRESNSFVALLWSSLSGCVVAFALGIGQRLATLTELVNAWAGGVRSMVFAIIILVLAWCIGAVCTDMQTPDYLVAKVSGLISPSVLPTIIFVIAAAISFSTGTSWGTMTILTPITIPLVIKISELNAVAPGVHEAILLSSIAGILAGSVFGDHCSPISDTTIMSSMASAADHIDHVRTQLPYAASVAVVAIVLGYLPAGFDFPSWVSLLGCAVVVFGLVMLIGKPDRDFREIDTS